MTVTGLWGEGAAAGVLRAQRRVSGPRLNQTPLEEAVGLLADRAVVSGVGGLGAVGNVGLAWFADVSIILVDSVLARDKRALDALDSLLRRVDRFLAVAQQETPPADTQQANADELRRWENWLQLTMEYLRSALERIAPVAAAAVARGTHFERFLRIVADNPGINSRQISYLINNEQGDSTAASTSTTARPMDEGQLSKIGNRLRTQGMVFAERSRHGLSWELTPRGQLLVDRLLGAHEDPDHPVESMLITTEHVDSADVAAKLSEAKPREVTVMGREDMVTYQRSEERHVPKPEAIEEVVDDLLGVHGSPAAFSIDDGSVYERVENSSREAVAVPAGV